MPGPQNPAVATNPVPPPAPNVQITDSRGYFTPAGLNMFQLLWAAIFGGGGIIDDGSINAQAPGATLAQAQSLFAQLSDQASPLGSVAVARTLFLEQRIASLEKLVGGPIGYPQISPSPVTWVPTVLGAGTAGSPTYSRQEGLMASLGPVTLVLFAVTLSAVGGIAGDVQIGGLPFAANTSAGMPQSGWLAAIDDVTFGTGNTQMGIEVVSGEKFMAVIQSGTGAASIPLDGAGLVATSGFVGGAVYFR